MRSKFSSNKKRLHSEFDLNSPLPEQKFEHNFMNKSSQETIVENENDDDLSVANSASGSNKF